MNKLRALSQKIFIYFSALSLFLLSSCSETPEKFFDTTILNTNVINDFGSPELAQHINDETKEFPDIPSSKKKGNEAVTKITNEVLYLEQTLVKIKKLSASGSEEEALKNLSTQLYELVIPVYKNEYMAYAKLCDSHGSDEEKTAMIKNIKQKYSDRFELKYNELMEKGKIYAKENNIQVNWGL